MKINIEPHALGRIKLIRLTAIHPIYGTKEVLAQLDHSEAIELAKALLALTEKDNPVKPKEDTRDWARAAEAAMKACGGWKYSHGADNGEIRDLVEDELRLHLSTASDRREAEEKDATIAMLSQQLQDKKEIIRRLTT